MLDHLLRDKPASAAPVREAGPPLLAGQPLAPTAETWAKFLDAHKRMEASKPPAEVVFESEARLALAIERSKAAEEALVQARADAKAGLLNESALASLAQTEAACAPLKATVEIAEGMAANLKRSMLPKHQAYVEAAAEFSVLRSKVLAEFGAAFVLEAEACARRSDELLAAATAFADYGARVNDPIIGQLILLTSRKCGTRHAERHARDRDIRKRTAEALAALWQNPHDQGPLDHGLL